MTFKLQPGTELKNEEGECEPNSNLVSNAYNSQVSIGPTLSYESNILVKANMDIFSFTGYPDQNTYESQPQFIADQISRKVTTDWIHHGYQTKQDKEGIAFIQVDLKQPTLITKYAVSGYPGGKHKPTTVFYLRASVDGNSFKTIAMATKDHWTNDNLGTYPFRFINTVTDPGFYRFYQFYGQTFDNQYLVIMNAGLWTPTSVQANANMSSNANKAPSLSNFTTDHVLYWIEKYINWGSKTIEKQSCLKELRNWNFEGKDLVKVDAKILETLNVKLPLVQQRIIRGRDELIGNPAKINAIIIECRKTKESDALKAIQRDIQSIKLSIANINPEMKMSEMDSGNLAFGDSWVNYAGSYALCKWFTIGNLVIVSGLAKSSNFNQKTIAILPEKCRPSSRIIFSLDQHSASFRVDVTAAGAIVWVNGVNTANWISLNGITFVIDK